MNTGTGETASTVHWEHHFVTHIDKFQMFWVLFCTSLSYWQTYQQKARLSLCSDTTNTFPLPFFLSILFNDTFNY
jgi:hypothetical protein